MVVRTGKRAINVMSSTRYGIKMAFPIYTIVKYTILWRCFTRPHVISRLNLYSRYPESKVILFSCIVEYVSFYGFMVGSGRSYNRAEHYFLTRDHCPAEPFTQKPFLSSIDTGLHLRQLRIAPLFEPISLEPLNNTRAMCAARPVGPWIGVNAGGRTDGRTDLGVN